MYGNQILYHIREGFRSIFSHGLMSFASSCMIVVCLLIMGSFSLVSINAGSMLKELEDDNVFLAFVEEDLTEDQARALQSRIEEIDNVADVTFVTRDEAMNAFLQDKDDDLFKTVPSSVLRHRFQIHVVNIELYSETGAAVKEVSGIADLQMSEEIASGFVMLTNVLSILAIVIVALLVVVSLFIISNTIRLTTFTRREEIAIMKMCGATDWFIRWPFIIEGVILGLVGALVAFFLEWSIYGLLHSAIESVSQLSFINLIPFANISTTVLLIFLLSGLLIGACGSAVAIRRFLRV